MPYELKNIFANKGNICFNMDNDKKFNLKKKYIDFKFQGCVAHMLAISLPEL